MDTVHWLKNGRQTSVCEIMYPESMGLRICFCVYIHYDYLQHTVPLLILYFADVGEDSHHTGVLQWWVPVRHLWIIQYLCGLYYNAWQWQQCRDSEHFIPSAWIQLKILWPLLLLLEELTQILFGFPADVDDAKYWRTRWGKQILGALSLFDINPSKSISQLKVKNDLWLGCGLHIEYCDAYREREWFSQT